MQVGGSKFLSVHVCVHELIKKKKNNVVFLGGKVEGWAAFPEQGF